MARSVSAPLDPPPEYAKYRHEKPVVQARLWNGKLIWLLTRYDDVRAMLGDNENFSTMPTRPGYPMITPGRQEFLTKERGTLNRVDPPEHTRLRRMITREFMLKRIMEKKPFIEELITRLLDEMAAKGPPADLVQALALPLPTIVISNMLGLPYEDHDFIQERTSAKLSLDPDGDPLEPARAQQDLIRYLERLFRKKQENPVDDDIFSHLIVEQVNPGHLTLEDAVSLAELLVVAGHETTANMIAMGTLLLLKHPDQMQKLRENPDLMPNAIEEMLRYLAIAHFNGNRVAIRDVEIGGQLIRAGEGVFGLLSSANRDENAFEDPDRFDITRNSGHHVTFGYGVHQCIGQTLARVELDIVFRQLLARFPNLALAIPEHEVEYKWHAFVFGVRQLPIKW